MYISNVYLKFSICFHLMRSSRNNMIMRTLLVILFANVAFFAESSDVIELSDDDFKSRTQEEDLMLVEFFAPW